MDKVLISNYESLPADIKAHVTNLSYRNTKEFLEIKEKNDLENEVV